MAAFCRTAATTINGVFAMRGIPTGVAFDIHRQIEKRRAQQAVTPDKFTRETCRQFVQVNVVAAPEKLAPPSPDNLVKDVPDNPV